MAVFGFTVTLLPTGAKTIRQRSWAGGSPGVNGFLDWIWTGQHKTLLIGGKGRHGEGAWGFAKANV